jgi:hypothetical protein
MRRIYMIGKTLGILAVLLALLIPVGNAAGKVVIDASGEWRYMLAEDGVTIMGYPWPATNVEKGYYSSDLIIPSELDGYTVTSIGENAFVFSSDATVLTIPDSVTSIGDNAFGYCGLTSVTIPNNVVSIGSNPFRACPLPAIKVSDDHPVYAQIDGVLIDKQQKMLVSYPSARKGVYTVPDEILRIGERAFSGCDSLSSVTIPDSVTGIGIAAFCASSLTDVTLPNSVTSIETAVFLECKSLTSITIPDSVTNIGKRAFEECENLTDVIIPESVTSIGSEAFSNCSSLSGLIIPASVTDIGDYAFSGCKNLTLTVQEGSYAEQYAKGNKIPYNSDVDVNGVADGDVVAGEVRVDATGQWVYVLSESGAAIEYMKDPRGNVVIPDELGGYPVTIISDWAFECSFMLTGITIPDSVTRIGDNAFVECYELKSIIIPKKVTSIGEGAFRLCYGLTSVIIPAGVTDIGKDAFEGCGVLTLSVAQGSHGEQYAKENSISYVLTTE